MVPNECTINLLKNDCLSMKKWEQLNNLTQQQDIFSSIK